MKMLDGWSVMTGIVGTLIASIFSPFEGIGDKGVSVSVRGLYIRLTLIAAFRVLQ